MYKVIKFFTDLQDDGYEYNVGDTFPRVGISVSDERLKELASNKNLQAAALIKEVVTAKNIEIKDTIPDDDVSAVKTYTKSEIMRMSKSDLTVLAESVGIDDAMSKTGATLKNALIEHFDL